MATTRNLSFSPLLSTPLSGRCIQPNRAAFFRASGYSGGVSIKAVSHITQASKLPSGVKVPETEPRLQAPFFGFTRNAEVWNSRACMIGLIGTFIVELVMNKGILEILGVDVGKGLDLPL